MYTRRHLLQLGLCATVSTLAPASGVAAPRKGMRIWDNHAGFGYQGPADIDLLDRWRESGIDYLSINVGYDAVPWGTTVHAIANYTRRLEERPDITLCRTYSDVHAAWRAGRMAVTYDIEGMGALNGDLAMVEFYYRLGVRQMLIAYNLNNDAGGGCHDHDSGLTDFGRAVIREMNRVGMVVDCAHSGIQSGLEALRLSTRPCIFSHANARALKDHERNITDEQIRAVAATGGVIGVNGLNLFLGSDTPTTDALVAHIDYIARLVGVAHVGIALDCDPRTDPGPGLDDAVSARYWPERQYPTSGKTAFLAPSALLDVPAKLRARGYSETHVRAIMADNFQRIAYQVWAR